MLRHTAAARRARDAVVAPGARRAVRLSFPNLALQRVVGGGGGIRRIARPIGVRGRQHIAVAVVNHVHRICTGRVGGELRMQHMAHAVADRCGALLRARGIEQLGRGHRGVWRGVVVGKGGFAAVRVVRFCQAAQRIVIDIASHLTVFIRHARELAVRKAVGEILDMGHVDGGASDFGEVGVRVA